MNQESIITSELGKVYIVRNRLAKRLIFRVKEGCLFATVPFNSSIQNINKVLDENSNRLKHLLQQSSKVEPKIINGNYSINTPNFKLCICQGSSKRCYVNTNNLELQLIVPQSIEFNNPKTQSWLKKVVEQILLSEAKKVLPNRLLLLAKELGLKVSQVKVNLSRGRWGSCSSSGNINLSAFILLLPNHLIRAVMLHELAHLTEMNHSSRFWSLLDVYSEGNAVAWSKELKAYKTSIL